MVAKLKIKMPGIYFCFSQTTMHHKDLLQLVFLELDHGHDMINFSELNRKSQQIFHQQIKVSHKPENEFEYERKYMKNNHNQRHGLYYSWHFNGQLAYEHNHYQDRLHGISRGWYSNGQLGHEHNYIQGRLHGISRRWESYGELFSESNYCYGKLIEK